MNAATVAAAFVIVFLAGLASIIGAWIRRSMPHDLTITSASGKTVRVEFAYDASNVDISTAVSAALRGSMKPRAMGKAASANESPETSSSNPSEHLTKVMQTHTDASTIIAKKAMYAEFFRDAQLGSTRRALHLASGRKVGTLVRRRSALTTKQEREERIVTESA